MTVVGMDEVLRGRCPDLLMLHVPKKVHPSSSSSRPLPDQAAVVWVVGGVRASANDDPGDACPTCTRSACS